MDAMMLGKPQYQILEVEDKLEKRLSSAEALHFLQRLAENMFIREMWHSTIRCMLRSST